MAIERCFLVPGLSAGEALEILASFARSPAAAEAAGLRIRLEGGGYATAVLPDPHVRIGSQSERQNRLDVFERLKTAAAAAMGRAVDDETVSLDLEAPGIVGAFAAAPRLLLESGRPGSGRGAEPVSGEALILVPAADEDAAWTVFDQLNFHATAVRVTAATPAGGGRAEALFLFHVRDDETRISSFQGVCHSGLLDGTPVLEGYAMGRQTIFLPPGTAPDGRALAAFFQVLASSLSIPSGAEGPVLALSAVRTDGESRIGIYSLHRLRYRDKTAFWRPEPADVVRIHDLADSSHMADTLAERIRSVSPLVGYELELRQGYPGPGAEMDLLRVQEKIAYYTELAAYLAGLARPQPILMRFAERDLPALADALRRFPLRDIDDGRLRYAFQATGLDDGVHYLLVAPEETAPSSSLPEEFWRGLLGAGPMVFRVDPFFARFYDSARPRSCVFVPEGETLFPPLHSWEQADIDGYLRSTLSGWFHGEAGAQAIPAEPFYLFRHGGKGQVVAEVLDAAAFVPVRRRIGWLNRNLELRHRLDVEGFIASLADKAGRAALADRVTADETAALDAFAAAAQRAERHTAGQLEQLLDLLAEEAGAAAAQAVSTGEILDRLYGDLSTIDAAVAELAERTRSVEDAMAALRQERKGFAGEHKRHEQDVVNAITAAEESFAALESSVGARIERLRGRYERLRDLLDGAWSDR